MFERLITAISQLQRNIEWFDPASLNDPVALTTAWHPAKRGGTNFRTHQLVQQGSQRLSFRPTLTSWLIASAFIGSGPLMAVLFYFRHPFPLGNIPPTMLLILAMCSVFSLIGVYYSARYLGTVTFDRASRAYTGRGERTGFDRIHAIQLLSEYCGGETGSLQSRSFSSYELNLVLENGDRINVTDHGDVVRLRDDAEKLAGFLGRPVWDAT